MAAQHNHRAKGMISAKRATTLKKRVVQLAGEPALHIYELALLLTEVRAADPGMLAGLPGPSRPACGGASRKSDPKASGSLLPEYWGARRADDALIKYGAKQTGSRLKGKDAVLLRIVRAATADQG